jgi:hypothetical protein
MKPGYKPGSNYSLTGLGPPNGADWTPAHPQFRLERREIWFTSQMNGFQVLRFGDKVQLPERRVSQPVPAAAARRAGLLRVRARRRGARVGLEGSLVLPTGVTRAAGCSGRVTVSARRAKRVVWLARTCRFRATLRHAKGRVTVRFEGTAAVAPARRSLRIR